MQHEIVFKKGTMHLFRAVSKFLISELESYEVKVGARLLFDGDSVDFGDGHIRSCARLKSAIRVGFLVLEQENYSSVQNTETTAFHSDTLNAGVRSNIIPPPSYLLPFEVSQETVLKERIMTEAELKEINITNQNNGFDPRRMGMESRENGDGRIPFSDVNELPVPMQRQGTGPVDPLNMRIQKENNSETHQTLGSVGAFANDLPPGVRLGQVSGGANSDLGGGVTLGSIDDFKLNHGQIKPTPRTSTAAPSPFGGSTIAPNTSVEAVRQARLAAVGAVATQPLQVKANRLELMSGLFYDLDADPKTKQSLILNLFATNIDILNVILDNESDTEIIALAQQLLAQQLTIPSEDSVVAKKTKKKAAVKVTETTPEVKTKPRTRKPRKETTLSTPN